MGINLKFLDWQVHCPRSWRSSDRGVHHRRHGCDERGRASEQAPPGRSHGTGGQPAAARPCGTSNSLVVRYAQTDRARRHQVGYRRLRQLRREHESLYLGLCPGGDSSTGVYAGPFGYGDNIVGSKTDAVETFDMWLV